MLKDSTKHCEQQGAHLRAGPQRCCPPQQRHTALPLLFCTARGLGHMSLCYGTCLSQAGPQAQAASGSQAAAVSLAAARAPTAGLPAARLSLHSRAMRRTVTSVRGAGPGPGAAGCPAPIMMVSPLSANALRTTRNAFTLACRRCRVLRMFAGQRWNDTQSCPWRATPRGEQARSFTRP